MILQSLFQSALLSWLSFTRRNVRVVQRFRSNSKMASAGFSLENYDCVGFDLDCTIAEYNVRSLHKLVYDLLLKYLIEEKNYGSELLLKPFEEMENFLQKGLFMDLKRGNILKINDKGEIVMATHGTTILNDEETIEQYGPNKTLNALNDFVEDPLSVINTPHEKVIRATLDCFDMPCLLLFARIVDSLDEKTGGASKEYNIWPDLLSGLYRLYTVDRFADGGSEFFSELKNNPCLYYKKWTPEKLNWLKELKSRKFVFLLTGSFIDFASLTAGFCLGEDWKDYFHVVLCYARKPFFFTAARPFLRVANDQQKEPVGGADLQPNAVYSQGNWRDLKALISRQTNLENPKCVYIGDNIIQDVYAPSHFLCCDSVAVSSELEPEFKYSVPWGSYYDSDNKGTSFWNHLIRNHAKICVSGLDVFVKRPQNFEYRCLEPEGANESDQGNGYYTN